MSASQSDRNVLFGVLALQMEFITQAGLIAALQAWTLQKSRPLGELLVELAHMSADDRAALEPMVDRHVARHGGSAEQSLAAISSVEEVVQSLKELGDPDLNASLVVATRGSRVSPPPPQVTGEPPVATEQSDVPTIIDAPRQAGRFRIVRPFKEGGLGQVSIAEDMELHREVAFKEIKPKYERDLQNRARFLLEGEITGKLEHPGIVPVYGLGQFSDGRPFYAMRFIRGQSLHDAIGQFHSRHSSSRLAYTLNPEFRQLIGRLIDVCQAIEYAHSKGVLHRDLKPDNVMLGKYGETLVVDWGLAKKIAVVAGLPTEPPSAAAALPTEPPSQDYEPSLRLSPDSGSAPTVAGQTMGTPKYMSPEQARGEIDKLGHATDVYALGAILFSVLTNQAPIGARPLPAGPEKLSVIEQVARAAAGKFPRPTTVNPAAPRALEAICLRTMSLRADSRYRTAKLLADDLQAWLDDQPVSAMIEPFSIRTQRWMKQHRTTVTTTAATILMSFLGVIGWGVQEGKHSRDLESKNEQLGKSNKELASKNTELAEANVTTRLALESAIRETSDALAHRREHLGGLYRQSGELNLALESYQEALQARRTLSVADPTNVELSSDLALTLFDFGELGVQVGKLDVALENYQQALELRRRLAVADPSSELNKWFLSTTLNRLGYLYASVEKLDEAENYYKQAFEYFHTRAEMAPSDAGAQDSLKLCSAISNDMRGRREQTDKNFATAIESYEKALTVLRELDQRCRLSPFDKLRVTAAEKAITACKLTILATGDWEALLKADVTVLPQSLLLRATEMLKRGELAHAVQAADKLCALDPKDKNNFYNAARVYTRCAEFITKEKPIPTDAEQTERQKFLNLALDCLKESLAAGWDDFAHMKTDDDLKPLRALPEFETLFPK